MKDKQRRNVEVAAEGGEAGIMKSFGRPVEEATASASQRSLALYRWWHAGVHSLLDQEINAFKKEKKGEIFFYLQWHK